MRYIHDNSKSDAELQEFKRWLMGETTYNLEKAHGDSASLKTTLFLYANRAYESKIPEEMIFNILKISAVKAGYSEREENSTLELFKEVSVIPRKKNGYDNEVL